jgi:putative CocE/NonD family hydrolase
MTHKQKNHVSLLKDRYLVLVLILLFISMGTHSQNGFTKENVMITLEDGVNLSTDLYFPAEGSMHPAILIRTPYGKHQHEHEGEYWSSNGYVVVIQDTRGKWDSDGEFIPFLHERSDGLETVDWIIGQDWSTGEVGLWGSSYLSYCAIAIATAGHEAVKTMFIISGWLQGDKIINPGGSMHLMLNLAWILHEETQRVRSIQKYDMEELFQYLPLHDVFSSIGIDSKIWTRDQDIRNMNTEYSASQIDIPVFHVSGWNDFVCNAALDVYDEISNNSVKTNKLLIGPWFHDQLQTDFTEAGDEDFGPESALGREKLKALSLNWFDHIIHQEPLTEEMETDVRLFLMGANKWVNHDSWPPENVEYQKWYLSSQEGANSSAGDGRLSQEVPGRTNPDTFVFDPYNPVPTHGGANFHFFLHTIGVKDQSGIEEREDVLVFTSDSLKEDIAVVGPIKVILHAATEGRDTDFTAKLVELKENGYARIIQEGIIRASYRKSTTERELLEPGTVYEMEIDLGATATQIPSGSRIRVEISSSNFPKYDRNPNTGEDAFKADKLEKAKQSVYHDRDHPSYLILPVINSTEI